jgi:hypothetical protein
MSRLSPAATLLLLLAALPLFAAADREASRAAIMIPGAGTISGANGTRFQTDLTITNQTPTRRTVLIDVYWLPRDVRGSGAPVMRLTLPSPAINFYEDFVTRTLNLQGLGSIILQAVTEDGRPDLAARIDAFARVWTPVPGGAGTTSQAVHASTLYKIPSDDLQPVPAMIYGLRQGAGYRSHYGIVNMSAERQTYAVAFMGNGELRTESVTVEASSMTHRAVPEMAPGPLTIAISITSWCGICGPFDIPAYTAYGSSVDNITGDGWYSKAQAAYPTNEP